MKLLKVLLLLIISTVMQASTNEKIELESRKISSLNFEILIPKSFTVMSFEKRNKEYPAGPEIVYTNEDGTINIVFTKGKSGQITQAHIPMVKMMFYNATKNVLFPNSTWLYHGVDEINGLKFGILEFISTTNDQKSYQLRFFTSFSDNLIDCTFKCPSTQMDVWKDIAHKIMNSLNFNTTSKSSKTFSIE